MEMTRQSRFVLAAVGLAVFASANGPARAETIFVEPDDFAAGTDISNKFPGVVLSVEDKPGSTVHSVDGTTTFSGLGNIATTGQRVFGQNPPPSTSVPQGWDKDNLKRLRMNFVRPTNFVQIDLICDDDDVGELQAFDALGNLLETFNGGPCDGRGPTPFVTAIINRTAPDIAYALAGGVLQEGMFLDNLQFNIQLAVKTTTTLTRGPRVNVGDILVDLAGLITGSNDAGPIDIGRSDSQFYEFILEITNTGSNGELDGKIISDPIPDLYDLDPLCGDDPVAASTSCDAVGGGTFVDRDNDTFADGIINDTPTKCKVSTTTSEGGGQKKKGRADLEPEFVTIVIDDLLAGETCTVRVFVRTDENPAKKTALFEPVACRDLDGGIFDTIPLNEGAKLFDPGTGDRVLGPVNSLQLTPNNCP